MLLDNPGNGLYLIEQVTVLWQLRDTKLHQAGLARTEHLTRAPEFEIFLGNLEAVSAVPQGCQAFATGSGKRRLVEQHTVAGILAPAHAAAQLM